jgi:CrcB protein
MTLAGGFALFSALAALGTLGRGGLAQWANRPGRVGWGTVMANVMASLALGVLVGATAEDPYRLAPGVEWAAGVGGLGALGTWSALATEVAGHLRNHRPAAAAIQIGASVGLGTLAAAAGIGLGSLLG